MSQKYTTYNNYELNPWIDIEIEGFHEQVFDGYSSIISEIQRLSAKGKHVFVFDLYIGVDKVEIMEQLQKLNPNCIIDSDKCAFSEAELNKLFQKNLTDDSVFGYMTHHKLIDCFHQSKIDLVRKQIEDKIKIDMQVEEKNLIFVIGTGASLITKGDVYFYFDLARWEIQLRYRKGLPNWNCQNNDAPILTKYKRGFFIEWRLTDKHKKENFQNFDYVVDTNNPNKPVMITGDIFRESLRQVSQRPFRVKPYFDPGVWGGQWMKNVFCLDPSVKNYAWSFDGVPEENSLLLRFGNVGFEMPCINLVLIYPRQLLGERVHGRFGAEFPIRFDLLDTMEGGNLSLQVHPMTEYIQETFGMHYTQDESYYILDATENDSYVYLGVKKDIDRKEMEKDLFNAQQGKYSFPSEKYINRFSVKKHDHVLIPAGTIHCSGVNTMVLEISATPYIFTFKLWDWERVGLDGNPRPIHVEHGLKNIQWDRDEQWVKENLINQEEICHEEKDFSITRTGLHDREFIETNRLTFKKPISCKGNDSVHMLNLVEGAEVTVTSLSRKFSPFKVHYGETFIIPASIDEYQLTPSSESIDKEVSVIKAWVR